MALDIGERRIGVALSDPDRIVATPLEVLTWGRGSRALPDRDAVLRRVADLIRAHDVRILVVGVPRSLDGQMGPQARYVMEWVQALAEAVDVPVEVQDERLSTAGAQRALLDANVRRRGRRQVIDKMAAALILETYLRTHHDGYAGAEETDATEEETDDGTQR